MKQYPKLPPEAAAKYFKDLRIRTDFSDGDPDFEESFYILRHTVCPAVLVENFFYDNQEDLRFLESEDGKELVTKIIVEGEKEYFLKNTYSTIGHQV